MTDLLEETTRDLKDEQKINLFRKLLPYIVGASALVASILWYADWQDSNKTMETQAFGDNVLAKMLSDDTTILGEVKKAGKAYDLVALKRMSEKIQVGDITGAMMDAKQIMNDTDSLEITKSFAALNFCSLALDVPNLAEADAALVISSLEVYPDNFKAAMEEHKPFAVNAYMLKAQWLIKKGDLKSARGLLEQMLLEENLSSEFRAFATILNNEIDRIENAK